MRKHLTMHVAAALVAALSVGAMTGCGNKAPSDDTAAPAAAEQTQEEIVAELKQAIANEPEYKSVTVTEKVIATPKGGVADTESDETDAAKADETDAAETDEAATAETDEAVAAEDDAINETMEPVDALTDTPETLESTTVYQFDASGDKLKTSMTGESMGIKIQYFSDGDDAVCVSDGPVYSGTTEQFDMVHFKGLEAYLENTVGDLNTIVDCVDTIAKEQKGTETVYTLTLDPEKYIKSDEILTAMAEELDDPVIEAVYTIGFDQDGHITLIRVETKYKDSASELDVAFSNFDSTVIDSMPEADKTYEDMEADIEGKFDTFLEDSEGDEEVSEETETE